MAALRISGCYASKVNLVLCFAPANVRAMLSTNLRTAWDGRTLAPLTKHDKIVATDPHICLICHVTGQELRQLFTVSDIWNRFANRFIWLADSHKVCERMKERNIPFIIYSGYDLDEDARGGVHVKKPASMSTLVAAVRGLLAERQISN